MAKNKTINTIDTTPAMMQLNCNNTGLTQTEILYGWDPECAFNRMLSKAEAAHTCLAKRTICFACYLQYLPKRYFGTYNISARIESFVKPEYYARALKWRKDKYFPDLKKFGSVFPQVLAANGQQITLSCNGEQDSSAFSCGLREIPSFMTEEEYQKFFHCGDFHWPSKAIRYYGEASYYMPPAQAYDPYCDEWERLPPTKVENMEWAVRHQWELKHGYADMLGSPAFVDAVGTYEFDPFIPEVTIPDTFDFLPPKPKVAQALQLFQYGMRTKILDCQVVFPVYHDEKPFLASVVVTPTAIDGHEYCFVVADGKHYYVAYQNFIEHHQIFATVSAARAAPAPWDATFITFKTPMAFSGSSFMGAVTLAMLGLTSRDAVTGAILGKPFIASNLLAKAKLCEQKGLRMCVLGLNSKVDTDLYAAALGYSQEQLRNVMMASYSAVFASDGTLLKFPLIWNIPQLVCYFSSPLHSEATGVIVGLDFKGSSAVKSTTVIPGAQRNVIQYSKNKKPLDRTEFVEDLIARISKTIDGFRAGGSAHGEPWVPKMANLEEMIEEGDWGNKTQQLFDSLALKVRNFESQLQDFEKKRNAPAVVKVVQVQNPPMGEEAKRLKARAKNKATKARQKARQAQPGPMGVMAQLAGMGIPVGALRDIVVEPDELEEADF